MFQTRGGIGFASAALQHHLQPPAGSESQLLPPHFSATAPTSYSTVIAIFFFFFFIHMNVAFYFLFFEFNLFIY
jgi:hypothetical protein